MHNCFFIQSFDTNHLNPIVQVVVVVVFILFIYLLSKQKLIIGSCPLSDQTLLKCNSMHALQHSLAVLSFKNQSIAKMARQGRCSASLVVLASTLLVITISLHFKTTQAANFTVGDTSGWTFNTQSWADGKKFKAGDMLSKIPRTITYFISLI